MSPAITCPHCHKKIEQTTFNDNKMPPVSNLKYMKPADPEPKKKPTKSDKTVEESVKE